MSYKGRSQLYWRLRPVVLERQPVCRVCYNEAPTEVDHILALSLGGEDKLENLQGICSRCHKIKSADDKRKAARRRKSARITRVNLDGSPPGHG